MDYFQFPQFSSIALIVLYFWSIIWKGIGLWKTSKNNQRNWFIAILVLNTVGILEIAYLFFFAKKKLTLNDVKFWETLIKKKENT